MNAEELSSAVGFLRPCLGAAELPEWVHEYEKWWKDEGQAISDSVDRAGTPWLRMFDAAGRRVDEILYPPDYWRMLRQGYRAGVLWRSHEQDSMIPAFLNLYVTAFHDPGLACPYTVSLSTLVPLLKYGDAECKSKFLPQMLKRDGAGWQGATWMTEIKGGSDLGAAVETTARRIGTEPATQSNPQHPSTSFRAGADAETARSWRLTGDKYFASNAGAELAVVAARPEGAPLNVRGLNLFLVPRYRADGELNYFIRRLKDKIATRSVPTGEIELRDSEAWLLGPEDQGIYLILEVLNLSRVANSVGSAALAQRALFDALTYAEQRIAFGKPIIQHPLLCRQFQERLRDLRAATALAWEAVKLLNEVWQERVPYSDRYYLFRLMAHLAKYWTAEFAVQTAKWGIEVHGGVGTLQEYRVERWLREAMILAIWEGTSHRQILDGLEVMQRKNAHRLLFRYLAAPRDSALGAMEARVEEHLRLPPAEREADAEAVLSELACLTARYLSERAVRNQADSK